MSGPTSDVRARRRAACDDGGNSLSTTVTGLLACGGNSPHLEAEFLHPDKTGRRRPRLHSLSVEKPAVLSLQLHLFEESVLHTQWLLARTALRTRGPGSRPTGNAGTPTRHRSCPGRGAQVVSQTKWPEHRQARTRTPNGRARIVIGFVLAAVSFGMGTYIGFDRSARQQLPPPVDSSLGTVHFTSASNTGIAVGTSSSIVEQRASLVADIKRQLQDEMGLLPPDLLRNRRESFVELYSFDDHGSQSYGTAGHLGSGYFITVKHGVTALGHEDGGDTRRIVAVKLAYGGRLLTAAIVDAGDATAAVEPGDWAILKVREPIDLPALTIDLAYDFAFAKPIFRFGNDYSQGILLSVGYVGQITSQKLVTCLADGHPGASGGGVLSQQGALVGISVGRLPPDYRFSFILPLRHEMFRAVSHLQSAVAAPVER